MNESAEHIAGNLAALRAKLAAAAQAHGRASHAIQLVAVSKTQSPEKIDAALAAGQRLFGENRVQEAQMHWQDRRTIYPDLRLHLIGPLQTNKVREAVALFDCIETVDRPKLVDVLVQEMTRQNRLLPCFIQVNTGDEGQKAGVSVHELAALLAYCRERHLQITGLMCIPPLQEPVAPHFALLQKLGTRHGLKELSMGMSADFELAVALGATSVRIGSALFGSRKSET